MISPMTGPIVLVTIGALCLLIGYVMGSSPSLSTVGLFYMFPLYMGGTGLCIIGGGWALWLWLIGSY